MAGAVLAPAPVRGAASLALYPLAGRPVRAVIDLAQGLVFGPLQLILSHVAGDRAAWQAGSANGCWALDPCAALRALRPARSSAKNQGTDNAPSPREGNATNAHRTVNGNCSGNAAAGHCRGGPLRSGGHCCGEAHRPPRPPADDAEHVDHGGSADLRRVFRRLCHRAHRRLGPGPHEIRDFHHDHGELFRHVRVRQLCRGAVRRAVRRLAVRFLCRGPFRTACHLCLLAALVRHRQLHDGPPDHRRRGQHLAVHQRARCRRRARYGGRVSLRADSQKEPRPGVCLPAGDVRDQRLGCLFPRLATDPECSVRL